MPVLPVALLLVRRPMESGEAAATGSFMLPNFTVGRASGVVWGAFLGVFRDCFVGIPKCTQSQGADKRGDRRVVPCFRKAFRKRSGSVPKVFPKLSGSFLKAFL